MLARVAQPAAALARPALVLVLLFHVIVLRLIVAHVYRGIGPHALFICAALTLVFSLPVAALVYALVERPFLARRVRWRSGGAASGPESPVAAEDDVPAPVARLA